MNVGELKKILAKTELPDDAEVVISTGRDTFHTCSAEPTSVDEAGPDRMGQVRFSVWLENEGVRNALLMRDTARV